MLSQALQKLKDDSRMSIKEISRRSGVPENTVTRILSGETESPLFQNVADIVAAMGGSLDAVAGITTPTSADEVLLEHFERAIRNKNAWIFILFLLLLVILTCSYIFLLCH